MKLGLGTVQFGKHYGVSNKIGKTPIREVEKILRVAHEAGIRIIDTAAHYGDSEEVLGKVLDPDHSFDIVTKIPSLRMQALEVADEEALRSAFFASLTRLRQQKVFGILMHDAADLLNPCGDVMYTGLKSLQNEGFVDRIGVSVYQEREIEAVLTRYPINLIQVPINVFDQRLLHSGKLTWLKRQGVEIHARSVFLQGLLLMEVESLAPYFDPIKAVLTSFQSTAKEKGISRVQAALAFLIGVKEIDKVILGINTVDQLKNNIGCYKWAASVDMDFSQFNVEDERMINPTLWPNSTSTSH